VLAYTAVHPEASEVEFSLGGEVMELSIATETEVLPPECVNSIRRSREFIYTRTHEVSGEQETLYYP